MSAELNESYTAAQASAHADAWCAKRPAWLPIWMVGETDQFYVQWDELSQRERDYWETEYGYNEFGTRRCKIETGFISGKGEFYADILRVPLCHNFMMVFRVGAKAARAIRSERAAIQAQAADAKGGA